MTTRSSRSDRLGALGKRSEDVRAKVTDAVKDEILRRSRENGMTESEFLAEFLEVHLFGFEHALNLHTERLKRVAGKGRE